MGLRLDERDRVVPPLIWRVGIFRGSDISQDAVESGDNFRDICGDWLATIDFFGAFFGFDLGVGNGRIKLIVCL